MSDKIKPKSRNPVIKFDLLKMYFGEPYTIDLSDADGSVTIYPVSLGDVVEFGQERFYANLNVLVSNTTTFRLPLWEAGVDWNEISDFELFIQMYGQVEPEFSRLIFHDFDLSQFELYKRQSDDNEYFVLYNEEKGIEINENVYFHISQYLRTMCQYNPKEEVTPDKWLRQTFIMSDKRELANAEFKKDKGLEGDNSLQPIISACVNHPGFKYKLSELKELGFYEFMDSVSRLQIYESATALMKGLYSGFVSGKDIPKESINFMRGINS